MKKTSVFKKLRVSQYRLALMLGITRQAVCQWGEEVPRKWNEAIKRLYILKGKS